MNVVRLIPSLRPRADAEPPGVAEALQQHRAPPRVASVSRFDEYPPPPVKQFGLQ